jgi:hypothetical protein
MRETAPALNEQVGSVSWALSLPLNPSTHVGTLDLIVVQGEYQRRYYVISN